MPKWKWLLVFGLFSFVTLGQVIKVDVRMVEVYVSVTDSKGKPVTNLQSSDFRLLEDGRQQEVRVFESDSAGMTLALLIDTTGSVAPDLPHVKNAVIRLLTALEPDDSVGLFTFATSLTPLSDFTTDRKKTLGAVLQTRAAGSTALFDSLAQLSRSISRVSGKKAILLFTDGDDNSSVLSLDKSLEETRRVGVPVYAMLYGRALGAPDLLKRLESISKATGGTSFHVRQPGDLPSAFQDVVEDLQHSFMLGYQSNGDPKAEWHTLKVELPAQPRLKITAKEGYWR